MQAYTTQRDPAFFPEPEKWDPARWIADGAINSGTPEQREMMLAWGKGTRACIGQHMATIEVKVLLSRLAYQFEFKLEGEQTHDDMVMTDHFTLIPKGKRCGLIFSEAADK
jgi:cytochrome P450